MSRLWIALGGLAGFLAVAVAAFAAHALPQRLDPGRMEMVRSALTMQGWHALALLATGLLAERWGGRLFHWAGTAFALGTLLFCGAVYALAIGGVSVGGVAPVGGTLLMLGWLLLLAGGLLHRPAAVPVPSPGRRP